MFCMLINLNLAKQKIEMDAQIKAKIAFYFIQRLSYI